MVHGSFSDYGFATPIAASLARLAFASPTPIQTLAIAPQLARRDLLGIACTGSGKTAAFGLPLLDALLKRYSRPAPRTCRALVLAPTRELATQIATSLRDFAGTSRLRICTVAGGASRPRQIGILAGGVDVVVATPGRLSDLMQARAIVLGEARHLVIDEADRMLDLGFVDAVRSIAAELAPDRQTVMFSATMPGPLATLAAQLLHDPVRVETVPAVRAEARIAARAELVAHRAKQKRLIEIVSAPAVHRAIVFCRTRRGADTLGRALAGAGLRVGVMHGDRSQVERSRTLARFRRGGIGLLVATDLVARGIDVAGVTHVINFDLPDDAETYIHRIGRTGRAGARGEAVTLCAPAEIEKLRRIERGTRQRLLPPMCRTCRTELLARRRPIACARPGCGTGAPAPQP